MLNTSDGCGPICSVFMLYKRLFMLATEGLSDISENVVQTFTWALGKSMLQVKG